MTGAPIVFIDPNSAIPYDESTSLRRGLGGTEQMVARIATGLASGHDEAERPIVVQQRARTRSTESAGVSWRPLSWPTTEVSQPTVVLVQHWKLLRAVRVAHPGARLVLWLHCFLGRRAGRRIGDMLRRTDARVLCVSRCHAREVRRQVATTLGDDEARRRVGFVYNAVEDDLEPDPTVTRDPNLFLSLSSKHKGQQQVLETFAAVRRRLPDARLMVADPGYFQGATAEAGVTPGVDLRGTLDRHQTLSWLRRASVLFYPQSSFRETFGLVFAEANAVGTPALAHPHGAAPEILDAPQLVDADDPDAVVERLLEWRRDGPPAVRLRPELRLRSVLDRWREELGVHARRASLVAAD